MRAKMLPPVLARLLVACGRRQASYSGLAIRRTLPVAFETK